MEENRLMGLRLLLLGDNLDSTLDETLELLDNMATQRFAFLIKNIKTRYGLPIEEVLAIPEELGWILDEVIIKRFNRIGSEGYKSQRIEGHSVYFSSDDFAEYMGDIKSYYDPDRKRTGGRLVVW